MSCGPCGKCLCGVCATICCLIIAIIAVGAVWVMNLKALSAGISSVAWQKLEFHPKFAVDLEARVWINNPNGWPLSGKILKATADVVSWDKNDPDQPSYNIGEAHLGNSLSIEEYQNSTFSIVLKSEPEEQKNTSLTFRLIKDCTDGGTTKVGLKLTSVDVSIWKKHATFDDLSMIPMFNATVPLPAPCNIARDRSPDAVDAHAEPLVNSETRAFVV